MTMRLKDLYNQKAVYWEPITSDGYGNVATGTATEILVRWEDVTEIIMTSAGEEKTSSSKIGSLIEFDEHGWLWLGRLTDLDSSADPIASGAFEVLKTANIPSLDGKQIKHEAWL